MKLVILHGFAQNGAVMRTHLAPLLAQLPEHVSCAFPDAPHVCSEASLTRLRAMLGTTQAPPHLCWWNASDDGRLYQGWEESLLQLRGALAGDEPFGLLGFSQGAIVTAALAALSTRAQFASPSFVVLVAGRTPRADALKPFFEETLSVPSLHVWGERDVMAGEGAPKLVEKFTEAAREVMRWDGPHVLPTFGPAASAILSFVRKHTSA